MLFRNTLFISLILSLFAVQGLAQTDSVYSRMILGSAGYKTIFGDPDMYARTQVENIQRLKSTELSERAVYKCFEKQAAQPEHSAVTDYAKKCTAALTVRISSRDTAILALKDPALVGIVPEKYLDNLMFVFIEDQVVVARDANLRSLDSLDKLLANSYMGMIDTRDTLNSFCNTPQFRSTTYKLLLELLDTVALLKAQLVEVGYASQDVAMLFYQLDTAMHRFRLGYKDTISDQWDPKYAGVGVAVYECEYILTLLRCNFNASMWTVSSPGGNASLTVLQREALYFVLHDILTGDLVARFYNYSYVESRTPVTNINFDTAVKRYVLRRDQYLYLVRIRSGKLVERTNIFPRAYILCIASKVKC